MTRSAGKGRRRWMKDDHSASARVGGGRSVSAVVETKGTCPCWQAHGPECAAPDDESAPEGDAGEEIATP
jgi:hypothetical protein